MAGSAIGGEVVLPRLDVVLGLAAGAVEPLVEVFGAAAFEVGDDEAGIGSRRSNLDPRDDALDPTPAAGGVVELRKAAQLAAARRHLGGHRDRPFEAFGRALLQRCDMAGESCIGGQAGSPGTTRTLPAPHNGCRRAPGFRPLANGPGWQRRDDAQSRESPPRPAACRAAIAR